MITQKSETAGAGAHRAPMLDVLRAVAILLVFGFHVATRYPRESLDALAAELLRVGYLGVDIFFPLSGFLLTRYLLTAKGRSFVAIFFLRRAFRILPLYLVAIAAFVGAAALLGTGQDVVERIWINLLFLTGWFVYLEGKDTVPYLVTWSLSVEEFGYLLLGVTAYFLRSRLPILVLAAGVGAVVLRYVLLLATPGFETFQALYYLPLARLDSIALGSLVAWAMIHWRPGSVLALLAAAGAVIVLLMSLEQLHFRALLFLAVAVGSCLFIVLAETALRDCRGLLIRALAAIGFYSYFNYLFQFFVIDGLRVVIGATGIDMPGFWTFFALTLAITQGLAILSFRWFEGPLIAWGRRLEGRLS